MTSSLEPRYIQIRKPGADVMSEVWLTADSLVPGVVPYRQVTIRLHQEDNVAIAKTNLQSGVVLMMESGERCPVQQFILAGHKVALSEIKTGAAIYRYGQIIGFASQAISPGQHVHMHNVVTGDFDQDYAFSSEVSATQSVPQDEQRTFLGYKRANGRVGTRNYVAVIGAVNCSSHVCRQIANHFTAGRLEEYANVDGVIALTHTAGCAGVQSGSRDYALLQRTLAGMARHPNVGAYILVGLGCETNQLDDLIERQGLGGERGATGRPIRLMIQELGGIRKTIQAGIAAVEGLLPEVNAVWRTPQPISELMLGLECGGSDSWSGITANPAVGLVADEVVRQGGTAVLSETPEIYGAEHLLTRRAVTPAVAQKLLDKISWWDSYLRRHDVEFDNNPGPGNKAGGLTNIIEKSLGAIAKSGSTNLVDVYDYADPVDSRGFVIMDTPGYDPVSVTGKVAGGCNLVLFTTGRGSVFGCKSAPSIKISSNSATFEHMPDDMDLNAGKALEGDGSIETVAAELLDLVVAVASGAPSKSEAQGVGTEEFVPWQPGAIV
jgi:altronate hydrolase